MTSRLRTVLLAASASFLYLKVRRSRSRIERLAAAALESLLNAIDANDPPSGAHARRVAAYSLILAKAADLDERARSSIERVALFHDIGKIHEALFDITHDGQSLSDAERRQICTHPQRGANVVAPLSLFYPDLGDGVLAHHERWDGRGYPRGLRGNDIPLAARIVALADTFDAITYHRRYGAVRSASDAVRIIADERARQFDPELTDLFLSPAVQERVNEVMRRPPLDSPVGPSKRKIAPARAVVPDVAFRWRAVGTHPEIGAADDALASAP